MNATEAPWASRERTTAWLAFYISLFVFLSIAKAPAVLLATRFWAEEGTLFYPHLRPLGMLGALLFIYSGSLYLIPGLTVFAATKVPLLYAPAVTTYTAFLVELLTAGLICWFI